MHKEGCCRDAIVSSTKMECTEIMNKITVAKNTTCWKLLQRFRWLREAAPLCCSVPHMLVSIEWNNHRLDDVLPGLVWKRDFNVLIWLATRRSVVYRESLFAGNSQLVSEQYSGVWSLLFLQYIFTHYLIKLTNNKKYNFLLPCFLFNSWLWVRNKCIVNID